MPLPSDERVVALSERILRQFERLFGPHPGFRPAHARGMMLTGVFTPSPEGATLTRAPHVTRASTPVMARFSNSTGIPMMPDNDPNANPRGLAIRFQLGERVHTDIVSHSADGFPTRTGDEFLEFLEAVAASAPGTPSPSPVERFLGSHPKALAYVQMPKPFPASFGRETYFGVTAMRFTNAEGVSRFGRFRVVPEAGNESLDGEAVQGKGASYLFEELAQRMGEGPIRFKVMVQVAEDEDIPDDATEHWPESRRLVELGRMELSGLVPDNGHVQKGIIFDPIPRVEGIEASGDPLLELRAAVYLISGRRRRAAPEVVS